VGMATHPPRRNLAAQACIMAKSCCDRNSTKHWCLLALHSVSQFALDRTKEDAKGTFATASAGKDGDVPDWPN
jgi:hypothetical protein